VLLVNTFDVEPWWATVPPCVSQEAWADMPDRSEEPLRRYLDLCDECGVKCTFFFIGWYAQNFPSRVRAVIERGHEAGCHSLNHEDVATLDPDRFRASTRDAKDMIEQAAGVSVRAYRAPSFSFPPERAAELFATLADLGFDTDSSVTTAGRVYGGGYSASDFPAPCSLQSKYGVDILEIPVPGVALAGRHIQVFGGGYLRLAPPSLLRRLARSQSYQVLYLHPHDLDRNLPPLPRSGVLSTLRRKLSIGDLSDKLRSLFAGSEVRACGQVRQEWLINEAAGKRPDAPTL
jgi:polysaccharide deacetylase family protein (PEP-CTERM system associated)